MTGCSDLSLQKMILTLIYEKCSINIKPTWRLNSTRAYQMKLLRAVVATTTLTVFASQAFAWGCPPWQMCGKRHNLIIPDSDAYSGAVAAAGQSAGSVSATPYSAAPGPLDIQAELQEVAKELAVAEARAAQLQNLQQSRKSGSSFWVLDRSVPTATEK